MKRPLACVLILLTLMMLTGCQQNSDQLSGSNPVTLTMWHVYGSQTESPLNILIDEFNSTVGTKNGIFISVVSVTNTTDIDAALIASANNEPGSATLPDLFTAYPVWWKRSALTACWTGASTFLRKKSPPMCRTSSQRGSLATNS